MCEMGGCGCVRWWCMWWVYNNTPSSHHTLRIGRAALVRTVLVLLRKWDSS